MSAEDFRDYPLMAVPPDTVQPAPRRVRAVLNGRSVLDTVAARYVWEWVNYPCYYIPLADVHAEFLVGGQREELTEWGTARLGGLRVGEAQRPDCARIYGADARRGVRDTVRFDFAALDAWYEEDEQIFVHPRNPYTRVDAIRSGRTVRIELDGTPLAESASPVMLYETGLPTRYYLDPGAVEQTHLVPSRTVTECPYKGRTSRYWSVRLGTTLHPDLAWSYHRPVPSVSAVAGLVAFYNERVDIVLDGRRLPRPSTHFFR